MKLRPVLIIAAFSALSLWLINDFFPGTLDALGIAPWVILAALAFFVIALLVSPSRVDRQRKRRKHAKLIFMAMGLGYPILLMALLSLLGGESSSGYSFASPPMWIKFAVFLWFSYSDDKKAYKKKMQESQE